MESRYSEFTGLITNINKYIQKIKNFEMDEFGLKGNQVQCLFHLFNSSEELTPVMLCKLCGEDKAAISRTLADLESKGLVIVPNTSDKKYKLPVLLTDKGKFVGTAINQKIDDIWITASVGINESERTNLYKSLNKINENLQEICKKYEEK